MSFKDRLMEMLELLARMDIRYMWYDPSLIEFYEDKYLKEEDKEEE